MLSLLGAFEQVYKTKCKESIKSVKKLSSLLPHTKQVNGSTYSVAKKNGERRNNSFFLLYIHTYIYSFFYVSITSHSLNLFPLS